MSNEMRDWQADEIQELRVKVKELEAELSQVAGRGKATRYDCTIGPEGTPEMDPFSHGDWVSFDDYEKLEDRIAELESRLAQREADCIHNIEEHARLGSRLGERIAELEAENAEVKCEWIKALRKNKGLEAENARLRLSADTWNRAFYDEAELRRELTAENQRLRDGISLHRADTKMRAGSLWGASQEDATLWALLGGGG